LFILVQNRTEPKMLSPTPNPPTLQKKLGLVALRDHRSWVWLGSRTQYLCIVNIKNISICIKNIVNLIIINIVNIKNIIICVIIIIIIIIILINSIDIKNIIICLINIIINNIINKIIYKFKKKYYQYEKNRINLECKIKNYYYYH
jgi:hypothetical protein